MRTVLHLLLSHGYHYQYYRNYEYNTVYYQIPEDAKDLDKPGCIHLRNYQIFGVQ